MDYLYILDKNNNTSIIKIKFEEDNFVPIEKYENLRLLNDVDNFETNTVENIFINNEEIIVWDKGIYLLREIEDEKEEGFKC